MRPIGAAEVAGSFVNCSKGDAKKIVVPPGLETMAWDEIDFLGWADPSRAGRSYLMVEHRDRVVGVVVSRATGGSRKAQMCKICLTTHPSGGVSLISARKSGVAGRQGNSVGTYMCTDLACSLYARNKKTPSLGRQYRESLDANAAIARVHANISAFVNRVLN